MATSYPPEVWPAENGRCLAIWSDYGMPSDRQRAQIRAYLAGGLGVPAEAKGREGAVTVQCTGSRRTYRVFYELYGAPQRDCR
jgi:hypothetical protein